MTLLRQSSVHLLRTPDLDNLARCTGYRNPSCRTLGVCLTYLRFTREYSSSNDLQPILTPPCAEGDPSAQPLAHSHAAIPFSAEHLSINDALPFDVRNAAGQLLLARDAVIESTERLAQLKASKLFVDQRESELWRRKLAGAIDAMVRQNQTLDKIAQARPDLRRRGDAREESLHSQWLHLRMLADMVLGDTQPSGA